MNVNIAHTTLNVGGKVTLPYLILRPRVPNIESVPLPRTDLPTLIWPCKNTIDYSLGLRSIWKSPVNLIIIEHDIEMTEYRVLELINCQFPLCSIAYKLYKPSTGLSEPVNAHRVLTKDGLKWIDDNETWANYISLGATKISYPYRKVAPKPKPIHLWNNLDLVISEMYYNRGIKWHIHWPEVPHIHTENHKVHAESKRYL